MAETPALIWRDWITDGVPASGAHKPVKAKIREWGAWVEAQITLAAAAGMIYATRALLYADLAHAAGTGAMVVGDATVAYNGVYSKSGASGAGAWTRVGDLPNGVIACGSAAGTANALTAAAALPAPALAGAAVFTLTVTAANTGPATLALNGGTAKAIETNLGNPLAAGYLQPGQMVALVDTGTKWRLLSDVASTADRAAAEAAVVAAVAAATSALGYMSSVVPNVFANRAAAAAFAPAVAPDFLVTAGYAYPGDAGGAVYKKVLVAPSHAGKFSITLSGGATVWYELADLFPNPAMFGAVMDGVTDDGLKLRDWIAYGKATGRAIYGVENGVTKTTLSLWLGTDTTAGSVKAAYGRRMRIRGACKDKPVYDLTGIENWRKMPFTGFHIYGDETDTPSCGILQARPKQASGVKSSGYADLSENWTDGHFRCAGYLNIMSEGNDVHRNFFFNYAPWGHAAAWHRFDYYRFTFRMVFDARTGAFTGGQTITGATSGATAKIIQLPVDTGGNTGWMLCLSVSGTFVDNETITDPLGGSATVNLPSGYTLMDKASPNAALGVEEVSPATSSWQKTSNNLYNNGNSANPDPTIFVSDWSDFNSDFDDFNHANATGGDLFHVQQDQTRNPAYSSGVSFRLTNGYLHAAHRNSISIGDPVSGGGVYGDCIVGPHQSAGVPSGKRIKSRGVATSYLSINDMTVYSDQGVDMTNANLQGNNRIAISDRLSGAFIANGILEGELRCNTTATVTITTGDVNNKMSVYYDDVGMSSSRRLVTATIASDAITASAPVMLIDTESSAAADDLITINLPNGKELNGQEIALRTVAAGRVVTVKRTGNIKGAADVVLNATDKTVTLIRDSAAAVWRISGGSF